MLQHMKKDQKPVLPNAKQVVITTANPSGIAATAKATAILK
jgi:hypothetical protein